MVSTSEKIKDESNSLHMNKTTAKKLGDSKSLCLYTNIFDLKNKTVKHRVGYEK